MKLLFVTNSLEIGGIEISLIQHLKNINYENNKIDLIILGEKLDLIERLDTRIKVDSIINYQYEFINKFFNNKKKKSPQKIYILLEKIYLKILLLKIKIAYKKTKYDIVVSYSQGASTIFASSLNSKKKIVFYHQGIDVINDHNINIYKKYDQIVCVSNGIKKLIANNHADLKNRIIVIHNYINLEEIKIKANQHIRLNCLNNRVKLMTCGRISSEKGMDFIINSSQYLLAYGIYNFTWFIVGDGEDRNKLEVMIKEKHLEKYIIILGWKKNPYPYIKECDIYIQPSLFESFGLSIVEAQVLKKPIVATKTVGAYEFIEDYVTGILVDIDSNSIAKGIIKYLEDSELKNKIINNLSKIDYIEFNKISYKNILNLYK